MAEASESFRGKKRKLKRKTKDSSIHQNKAKAKWRKLEVPDSIVLNPGGGGFFSLEELTDYSDSEFAGWSNSKTEERPEIESEKVRDKTLERKTKMAEQYSNAESNSTKQKNIKKQTMILSNENATEEKVKKKSRSKSKKKSKSKTKRMQEPTIAEPVSTAILQEVNKVLSDDVPCQKSIPASNHDIDMSDWNNLGVPDLILKALAENKFTSPTAIQAATLPIAIFNKQDVIGAAETGSGKTLAFAIPILAQIMETKEKAALTNTSDKISDKPLYCLIMAPTRELALQVKDHIIAASKYIDIHCVAIVGGLSQQKQERLLCKGPEIVVGTPGRIYKLISDGQEHLNKFDSMKYFVIDEVDRMLQFGHYQELYEIMNLFSKTKTKRQTFIFSATLTVPQFHKKWSSKSDSSDAFQKLVEKTGISSKARVIDQTTKHVAAQELTQLRVVCAEEEKDLYLYYILLSHPGRTLVFVNSISYSRKLSSLLSLLGKEPLQLHAGKQQRQRLKMLDRFLAHEDGLLVATDVAARGLDIADVQNVVHFHLPVDPKIYIHRSGRTARAKKAGTSIILEGPHDFDKYKKVCSVMKLSEDIPLLDVQTNLLPDLKKRVVLAKKIEKEEHHLKKHTSEKNWFKMTAKSMEIELDESSDSDLEHDKLKMKKGKFATKQLKHELTQLLKLPIIPKGFSGLYPTKSGKLQNMGLA